MVSDYDGFDPCEPNSEQAKVQLLLSLPIDLGKSTGQHYQKSPKTLEAAAGEHAHWESHSELAEVV